MEGLGNSRNQKPTVEPAVAHPAYPGSWELPHELVPEFRVLGFTSSLEAVVN